jgi:AcrR family transcriptional regulator
MLQAAAMLERSAPETTRREQAKNGRRLRVVEAAYALLREVGIEDLSMKMLAARAGVSLSTVYNLFGSKQAVLALVFDFDLLKYQRLVDDAPSQDALERIFDSIDIAVELYRADPDFYRATFHRAAGRRLDRDLDPFLSVSLREPRNRFWRSMIAAALTAGLLKPGVDPAVLGALVIQIFGGVLADWIAGDITVDELGMEAKFGIAVALSPFATRPVAARLRGRIHGLHKTLSRERALSDGVEPPRL